MSGDSVRSVAILKSYDSPDPLIKYTIDHSKRLTKTQEDLNEVTLNHPKGAMLGAPEVLQLNQNLIRAIGGKKVLDIGVFTGASSLAAALAIPEDGKVHALDVSEEFTNIGRPYWKADGVEDKIHLHINPAEETLDQFINSGQEGTFDFAFIDADKTRYETYVNKCHTLLRSGGIISIDNTLYSGKVLDPDDKTPNVVAIRKLNEKLKDDHRFNISFLNIGDGVTLLFKK